MSQEVKNILGIRQDELAMILGVGRGQLSMYLIGKRSMPIDAKLLLADLISNFSTKKKQKINNAVLLNEAKNVEKIIKSIQLTNEFKQIVLQKKLNVIERKYDEAKKTIALIEYLETLHDYKNNEKKQLYELIKTNAEKEIQKNSMTKQIPIILELEALINKEIYIRKQFLETFSSEQKL